MSFVTMVNCRLVAAVFLSVSIVPVALAQALSSALPEDVVARRGGVEITIQDLDIKLRTLPPELRAGYMTESDRASRMIDTLLLTKQLANSAVSMGVDQRPDFVAELELAKTELLARYAVEQNLANAILPNVEDLARERYLSDPQAMRPAPRIDVSHILISTDGKQESEAKALAEEALKRAQSGEDFLALAEFYGEGKSGNPTITNVDFTRMDPKFSLAVAELNKKGDITGPVRSQFGYHVIRLDTYQEFPVPSFEDVKAKLVEDLTIAAKEKVKNDFLGSFSKLETDLNDAAIQRLRERYLPGKPGDVTQPLKVGSQAGAK